MATRPGFEPGISAPKADVLPLHHRAIRGAAGNAPCLYSATAALWRQVIRGRRCFGHQEPLQNQRRRRLIHRSPLAGRLLAGLPQQGFGFYRCEALIGGVHRGGGAASEGVCEPAGAAGLWTLASVQGIGDSYHEAVYLTFPACGQHPVQVFGQLGAGQVPGREDQRRGCIADGQADCAAPPSPAPEVSASWPP